MTNYKQFSDPNNGISFEYPEEWEYQTEGSVGVTIFARKDTLENIHERPFDPIFNVISSKLSNKASPETFINSQLSQLQYMAPDAPLKVEDIDLSGVTGKKVFTRIRQGNESMSFIAVFATFNGTGYAMFFHCDSQMFKTLSPVVAHMITTIKFSKFANKLLTLHPFIVQSANMIIRYPSGYEVIKKADDDNSKAEVTFILKDKNQNGEETKAEIKVVIQKRTGTLDEHVDMMKDNLERMLVDEVNISKLRLGTVPSVSFTWRNDAKMKNGYFMHLLTSENDEAPIIAVSFVSNFIESETRISDIFKAVRNSIRFLSDPEFDQNSVKWNTHYSLDHKVGLHYNPDHFVFENVPLTEGSFIMKEDENKDNPRCNFALMVKTLESEARNLDDIEKELIRNLSELCDNAVEVIQKKDITMLGFKGKLTIFKGEAYNPMHNTKESLIFVYKFLIADNKKSIMFAFSSSPDIWEREWAKANTYIGTLFLY